MKINIKFLIFVFLGIYVQTIGKLHGQNDSTKLEFNQIEVVKSFEVKLKDVEPLSVAPVIPTPENKPLKYTYQITPVNPEIQFSAPEIKALAMQPDEPYEPYNGFIKAGYGNRKSPFLEASYGRVRKDVFNWGGYGKYEHVNDSEKILNQKFTNIRLDAFGSYVWKNNTRLDGAFENLYKQRVLWNENLSNDSIPTIRNTNFVKTNISLANIDLSAYNLNYQINAGIYNLRFSDQSALENQLFVEGQIEKFRSERLAFVWPVRLETTLMKSEEWNSLFNVLTSPHIIFQLGKIKSVLGASALLSNSNSAIFPKINFSLPVISNSLQIFLGSDQRVFSNTLANLNTINPFFNTNLSSLTNTVTKDLFAGIKGDVAHISYQVNVGYKWIKDMSFFTLDTFDILRHKVIYDGLNALYLSGNAEYRITPDLKVGGWITQNFFSTDSLVNPFQTPALHLASYVKASFLDKTLNLTSEFIVLGSYHYVNELNNQETQGPLFDLTAGVEYFPLEYLGIYLRGSNILNQNYQRWQGYRNIGIQVSGGVFFKF